MGLDGQYRALVAAALLALLPGAAGAACRLALALGFDISRSVSERDYAIQKDGILAALAAPEIRDALLKPEDKVALSVFEWSGPGQQSLVLPWTLIATEADLTAVIAVIAANERRATSYPTGLGAALAYGRDLLGERDDCASLTLDISGDGRNNDGPRPDHIYLDRDFGDILVNGLAIAGHESNILRYYEAEVIHGRGAFVEFATTHLDFPRAIRRKLERELTEGVVSALPGGARRE